MKIAATIAVSWMITLSILGPPPSHAEDFSLNDERYNGIGRALTIFEEEGLYFELTEVVDFSELDREDAVLLLHVGAIRSARGTIDFIERGGALLLADEGDTLEEIYARFGFTRQSGPLTREFALHGFDGVYLAPRYERHSLSDGVDFLITDHPRPFFHESLSPLFTLAEDEILVAVGRLGAGELIAIGDSSLFINQLARLSENDRFLRNLGRHLAGRYARLLIVLGPGTIASTDTPSSARGLGNLREGLLAIGAIEIDPLTLHLASIVLLIGLTLMLGSKLHRGVLFQGPRRLGNPAAPTGIEWDIRTLETRGADLGAPIRALRQVVYAAMTRRFARRIASAAEAKSALAGAGLSLEKMGIEVRFFERLDEFALSSPSEAEVRASRRELVRFVRHAEVLLNRLEERE